MTRRLPFFTGLFLICMSTLMLQIILTRILSVVAMYYLAFLSISMAMLGMTAGAILVYLKLDEITSENVSAYLSRLSTAFALAICVAFLLLLASPLVLLKAATGVVMWGKALVFLAAPFLVAGVAVSLALTRSPFPVGITYGVDLLGAAFGCLVVPLLLNYVDAPSAMFFVAALTGLAGVCFRAAGGDRALGVFPDWRLLRRPGVVSATVLALAFANGATRYGFQPMSAKSRMITIGTDYDFDKWNSFSHVTVTRESGPVAFLWGGSPALPSGMGVDQRYLDIDNTAGTSMARFTGDTRPFEFLKYDITNLVYWVRPGGRVGVVGVGGGRDVLSAYVFGSRDVTGVELNPILLDLLTDSNKFRSYAGLADLPGIRLVVDEGRSWFARTTEKFDVIEMSMVDTFAATGAGAFALSENSLYTVEGWRVFLSALSPTGLFTVSRWHSPSSPIELGRTTSLAVAALLSLGAPNPRDHIFIAGVGSLATVIVSRQPFTATDLARLKEVTARMRFETLASPDQAPAEPMIRGILSATTTAELDESARGYWLDLSPPSDSRPFFFNQVRLDSLDNITMYINILFHRKGGGVFDSGLVHGNLVAIGTLFLLIVLSFAAVVLAVILPAFSSLHDVRRSLAVLGSAYFLLIGLGFMFVEIGLIQRISVFLGHPIYALSIVLFSIILSTGVGSLLSERFMPTRPAGILLWLSVLVIYLLGLPYILPLAARSSLESASLLSRALVSVAIILPAGMLMGFAFPLGMRLVTRQDARPTPWFWGVNGAAGVLAAGLAVTTSIAFSVDTTIRIGALCYILLLPTGILLMALPVRSARGAVEGLASSGAS